VKLLLARGGAATAEPAHAPAPQDGDAHSAADPPIVPLVVPGFQDAVVSVPLGMAGSRPVVVATHEIWDFPEGLCEHWRSIVGDRA
jgi:hypothetical protein